MRLPQSLLLLAVAGSGARASSDKTARPRGVAPECECQLALVVISTPDNEVSTAGVHPLEWITTGLYSLS